MDNIPLLSRNKSIMSVGLSKIHTRDTLVSQNNIMFQDKLFHDNCHCFHCINNTKPIQQPIHPRISGKDEYQKLDNQAFTFLVQKMTDFIGTVKIPDTFIAQNSSFVYISNNKSKIKTKLNFTLPELKKYFDARRIQYNNIIRSQNEASFGKLQRSNSKIFNQSSIRFLKKQTTMYDPVKKQKQMKEVAIINYENSFNQIVTESSLNKYLSKRKNDPFWQQISSISLIPPYKEEQLTYHKFSYERTEGTIKQMDKQMERVAKIIDSQDKYNDMASVSSTINPENDIDNDKIQLTKLQSNPNYSYLPLMKRMSFNNVNQEKVEQQTVAKMSKEIVAYFEVKLHIRISSCLFKYIIDFDGNYYLTGVQKFIAHNLKKNELHFVHDRFTDLEINDSQQIAELKMVIESKQSRELQNELAQLVADCLQKRKNELTEVVYKRPSNENLVKIFKRIFPTFNQEQVFTNKNWKNQFPVYMLNCRKTINKVIRDDEGIRILKRFGINFYRTWN